MTIFADIARLNMGHVFANDFNAVMAIDTVTGDIYVIEVCRQPTYCRMAIIAIITACYVRCVLTRCCVAVMTGSARAQYLCMVDRRRWHKCECAVAVFTDIAGRYVR
jgi:hypothetical protein